MATVVCLWVLLPLTDAWCSILSSLLIFKEKAQKPSTCTRGDCCAIWLTDGPFTEGIPNFPYFQFFSIGLVYSPRKEFSHFLLKNISFKQETVTGQQRNGLNGISTFSLSGDFSIWCLTPTLPLRLGAPSPKLLWLNFLINFPLPAEVGKGELI